MPYLSIRVPDESFLVRRGRGVFHVGRDDVCPESYSRGHSLVADHDDPQHRFDARQLSRAEVPGADAAALIRARVSM